MIAEEKGFLYRHKLQELFTLFRLYAARRQGPCQFNCSYNPSYRPISMRMPKIQCVHDRHETRKPLCLKEQQTGNQDTQVWCWS